jgi:hypothetical protein
VGLTIKPGASTVKMTDRMRVACAAVEDCYLTFGAELILTSGDESETVHAGRPVAGDTLDPHYLGKAADFSIKRVPAAKRQDLVDMIERDLGEDFVVLWEAAGTEHEHLHVQHGHVVP